MRREAMLWAEHAAKDCFVAKYVNLDHRFDVWDDMRYFCIESIKYI
jgi:hypothetical protein